MDGHTGSVVIGEPDAATGTLHQCALGAVSDMLVAPVGTTGLPSTLLETLRQVLDPAAA